MLHIIKRIGMSHIGYFSKNMFLLVCRFRLRKHPQLFRRRTSLHEVHFTCNAVATSLRTMFSLHVLKSMVSSSNKAPNSSMGLTISGCFFNTSLRTRGTAK